MHGYISFTFPAHCVHMQLPAISCLRVVLVEAAAHPSKVATSLQSLVAPSDSLASAIANSCCACAGLTSSASLCTAASSLQSAFAAAASLPFEMDSDEPAASPSPNAAAERLARRSESEPLAPAQQPAVPKPKSTARSAAFCSLWLCCCVKGGIETALCFGLSTPAGWSGLQQRPAAPVPAVQCCLHCLVNAC